MTLGAFDSGSYRDRYGGALSQLAGEDYVQGQDQLSDPNQQPDMGLESAVQSQRVANSGAAPMPSPMQMSRMGRMTPPPKGAALGGGGALSPQSSSPFFSPDQQQSASVYDYTDNAPKEQLDAHARHIDETVGAGTDQHGIKDLNHLWEQTYQDQLNKRGQSALMDEKTAAGFTQPTWKDKLAMMLDAANRASIIQAQNPQMSQGQIWAAATRGAMDGWEAHSQGAHDAYLNQQNARRKAASDAADKAVQRGKDEYGLWAKGEQLRMTQEQRDETKRHNIEDEKNKALELGVKKTEAGAKAANDAKGDLITLDQDFTDTKSGKTYPKGTMGRYTKDGRFISQGLVAKKTGTEKADAGAMTMKEALDAQKESDAAFEKSRSAIDKVRATDPVTLEMQRKDFFKQHAPKAYKIVHGDEPDLTAPPPAPGGKAAGKTPSWYKPQS